MAVFSRPSPPSFVIFTLVGAKRASVQSVHRCNQQQSAMVRHGESNLKPCTHGQKGNHVLNAMAPVQRPCACVNCLPVCSLSAWKVFRQHVPRCLCRFCCSNTGLGLDPGSLSLSVPLPRPSPSTGLASSQLQAWQFLLRRHPTAQRRLSTSASHCPVSLITAILPTVLLCCAGLCCALYSLTVLCSCCLNQADCLPAKRLACQNKL